MSVTTLKDLTLYMPSPLNGYAIRITAIATSMASANEYCAQHRDAGVLSEFGPLVFIAQRSDMGKAGMPCSLAAQMRAVAANIDAALLPECREARAALASMHTDHGVSASVRRIARDLHDAIPSK
jgi:hypothetical protein